ncbi:MAG: radical SAM protein, partial [Elusimicrobia bacterium]|nr:radical SAM protein [Elusimicrobiota bacterium]
NTLSGAALVSAAEHFDREVRPVLEAPAGCECGAVARQLLAQRMLVPEETDEPAILRRRYASGRADRRCLQLTVLPTLRCNFRCAYCFEPHRAADLGREQFDRIRELVAHKASEIERLELTWFGGEPMLAHLRIREWSRELLRLAEARRINYRAGMVTNGYLMGPEHLETLAAARVKALQITLDGPRRTHDSRRVLAGGGPTYDRILRNLEALRESRLPVRVALRVNLDKDNAAGVEELLADLSARRLNEWCRVYFARVERPTRHCGGCPSSLYDCAEFSTKLVALSGLLLRQGFSWDGKPVLRKNFCGAGLPNSFVVDARGDLFQCWHDVGHRELAVGSLDEGPRLSRSPYASLSPFDDPECLGCGVLPLCMGGCPYYRLRHPGPGRRCVELRFNLKRHLSLAFSRELGREAAAC